MVSEEEKWDLALFRQVRKGDCHAFRHLFDRHYSDLCNFANLVLKNETFAEEVVQEIFIYLWRKRKVIIIRTSVKAYLYNSVRNKTLNAIRKEKNGLKAIQYLTNQTPDTVQQPDQILESNELKNIIRKVIDALPQQCRTIYILSREKGYSNKRISAELKISEKTVENQMTKALRKLRESTTEYTLSP